ncbi:hypothetical protein ED312_14575 [Sinomicrobium pectinilyticum]|uniref:Uncharacterized protein n=1 Tax=Sinomicrobium pectinilyticum TaxID=1084421 RepID=A0A3N0E795_SINP1|nr:hypothetical protein [Sinomicrobium pectinilyticum]RNL83706.1 hypothetical protein ED312_14575 [Sinomicrobium pectinilyticum]
MIIIFQYIQSSFKYRWGIYAIFGMGILTNCSRIIPCNLNSGLDAISHNPKPEFLIGKYKLDAKTIKTVKEYKNIKDGYLIIKSDGTFEMKNIPEGTFDFDAYYDGKIEGIDVRGSWKSTAHDESAHLVMDINFNKEQTDLKGYLASWQIYVKDEKAVILIPIGDPDECMAVRFLKE